MSLDEAAWGEEDDDLGIEADEILGGDKAAAEESKEGAIDEPESDIFMPPSDGADPLQAILRKNPTNAAINAAAGNFPKGLELLKNQLGITNFEPLK